MSHFLVWIRLAGLLLLKRALNHRRKSAFSLQFPSSLFVCISHEAYYTGPYFLMPPTAFALSLSLSFSLECNMAPGDDDDGCKSASGRRERIFLLPSKNLCPLHSSAAGVALGIFRIYRIPLGAMFSDADAEGGRESLCRRAW